MKRAKEFYDRHQYSGPRVSRKRSRAAITAFYGPLVTTRAQAWDQKPPNINTETEPEKVPDQTTEGQKDPPESKLEANVSGLSSAVSADNEVRDDVSNGSDQWPEPDESQRPEPNESQRPEPDGAASDAGNSPSEGGAIEEFPSDCAARGCGSTSARQPSLLFFPLPDNPRRCLSWLRAIERTELALQEAPTLHADYRVCARHFHPSDILPCMPPSLADHAVPVLNLPAHGSSALPKVKKPKKVKQEDIAKEVTRNVTSRSISTQTRSISTQTEPALEGILCVHCERLVDPDTRNVVHAVRARKGDRVLTASKAPWKATKRTKPTATQTGKNNGPKKRKKNGTNAEAIKSVSAVSVPETSAASLAATSDDDHDQGATETEELLVAGGEPLISATEAAAAPPAAVFVFEYRPGTDPSHPPAHSAVSAAPTHYMHPPAPRPHLPAPTLSSVPTSSKYLTISPLDPTAHPIPSAPSVSHGPIPTTSHYLTVSPLDPSIPAAPNLSLNPEPAPSPFAMLPPYVPVQAPPDTVVVKVEDDDMDVLGYQSTEPGGT